MKPIPYYFPISASSSLEQYINGHSLSNCLLSECKKCQIEMQKVRKRERNRIAYRKKKQGLKK